MLNDSLARISWRNNENAVEIGFEYYLDLLCRRIKGEDVSLIQELRKFFDDKLGIKLRETQARGLMHRTSSVFVEYVKGVAGQRFNPTSQYWQRQGIRKFEDWRSNWVSAKKLMAVDVDGAPELKPYKGKMGGPIGRETVTVSRVVRDTALSRFLKTLYASHCQVCKITFKLPGGQNYSETHHIRPLGQPHSGEDVEGNMIVLCAHHHAMFDYGVIAVHPQKQTLLSIDDSVVGIGNTLLLKKHKITEENLEYHLENIYGKI